MRLGFLQTSPVLIVWWLLEDLLAFSGEDKAGKLPHGNLVHKSWVLCWDVDKGFIEWHGDETGSIEGQIRGLEEDGFVLWKEAGRIKRSLLGGFVANTLLWDWLMMLLIAMDSFL